MVCCLVPGGLLGSACSGSDEALPPDPAVPLTPRPPAKEPPESPVAEAPVKSPAHPPLDAPDDTTRTLRALGYVESAPTNNPQDRGVTKRTKRAALGLNLYNSRHLAVAKLIGLDGRVLHTWEEESANAWMHVEMQPNGDLFAISKDRHLIKLDWHSKVLWRRQTRAHHDFWITKAGRIHLISRRITRYPYPKTKIPILEDQILVLSPEGKPLRRTQLFGALRSLFSTQGLQRLRGLVLERTPIMQLVVPEGPSDIMHTNSIQVLSRGIPDVAPAGSVLLSVRQISRLVILNADLDRILWEWGEGELEWQHHATLLDNGNILVLDNGIRRGQSRVLEINPTTRRIVWSFTKKDFYTAYRGGAQKLPNGNILITESDEGHIFEVTPDREVVWDFWNPDIDETNGKTRRGAIYRMTRYEHSYLEQDLLSN